MWARRPEPTLSTSSVVIVSIKRLESRVEYK